MHDLSKFLPYEFAAYRDKFIVNQVAPETWSLAANHHLHANPHHWEYWVFIRTGEPLPMPEKRINEMVADWLATGFEISGNWDISEWFKENYPSMKLHEETRKNLLEIFSKHDWLPALV